MLATSGPLTRPGAAQAPASPIPGPPLNDFEFVDDTFGRTLAPSLTAPAETEVLPAPDQHLVPVKSDALPGRVVVENNEGLVRLVVRDAPLRQVLALLAESQKLNLVFATVSDAKVTVSLDRVPLATALDAILSSCGYTWTLRGNIVHVTAVAGGNELTPGVQGRRLEVFELDYLAAADVDLAVKGLLSPIGKSWVMQSNSQDNRRTKEVVAVEDLPEYVERIAEFVAQTDVPPRQVLVEVQILEVRLDDALKSGVNWDTILRLDGAKIGLESVGLANPDSPQTFFLRADATDLNSLVDLLETTNDAKTLASPKLLAVNGQEAKMQIGKQLPYRETTNSPSNVSQESVKFLDVGVILTITPWITRDGRVLMRVTPEVSDGALNSDGLPETVNTTVSTDVFLANGQGMVIGGLIRERDSINISKLPWVGDMRYIGPLFQRRESIRERSEIIVALMPHLLPYDCRQQEINDAEVARARDPLTYGPLCRYPRPYEPRLVDAVEATHRDWEMRSASGQAYLQSLPGLLRRLPPPPAHCHSTLPEPIFEAQLAFPESTQPPWR